MASDDKYELETQVIKGQLIHALPPCPFQVRDPLTGKVLMKEFLKFSIHDETNGMVVICIVTSMMQRIRDAVPQGKVMKLSNFKYVDKFFNVQ